MEKPLVSICIPAYEMKGKGAEFLEFSFGILLQQTYKNFEVIVSDHSVTSVIEEVCTKWKSALDIKHYYNDNNRGMFPHNMNNAISKAKGTIIKTLCQDDFLYTNSSLETMVFNFTGGKNYWMVSACCHTQDGYNLYNPFYPYYNQEIQYGKNSLSSPSVLMFRNEDVMPFDENLFWLVDCDYYKRLYDKYGLPGICNEISVVNREDISTRVSASISQEVKNKEYEYIINKYKKC